MAGSIEHRQAGLVRHLLQRRVAAAHSCRIAANEILVEPAAAPREALEYRHDLPAARRRMNGANFPRIHQQQPVPWEQTVSGNVAVNSC